MLRIPAALCLFCALLIPLGAQQASAGRPSDFPVWAYPVAAPAPAGATVPKDDGHLRHVPDSSVALALKDFAAHVTAVPDWHPEDHPPDAPPIVSVGRGTGGAGACAPIATSPMALADPKTRASRASHPHYFKQQLSDFKNAGRRAGSEPARAPQNFMIALAKAATDEEISKAADYFASLKPECYVTVIESEAVPVTYVAGAMLAKVVGAGTEALGDRIIEFPVDLGRAENRDPRTPYLAYVPVGSLEKGAAIAAGKRSSAQQCSLCHGPGLKGLADVPRLAGRVPQLQPHAPAL